MFVHQIKKNSFVQELSADPFGGFLWCERRFIYESSGNCAERSLFSFNNGEVFEICQIPEENADAGSHTGTFRIDTKENLFYEGDDKHQRRVWKIDINKKRNKATKIKKFNLPEISQFNFLGEAIFPKVPDQSHWDDWSYALPRASYFYVSRNKGIFLNSVVVRNPNQRLWKLDEISRQIPLELSEIRNLFPKAKMEKESNVFIFDMSGNFKNYTIGGSSNICIIDKNETIAAVTSTDGNIFFIDIDL